MSQALVSAARQVVLAMDSHLPMHDSLARLRRALEAHEQRDGFGEACWSVDDVLGLRSEWSEEKARGFLIAVQGHIQDAMVEAGWFAIEELLWMEEHRDQT
jgi:hypothetical protein